MYHILIVINSGCERYEFDVCNQSLVCEIKTNKSLLTDGSKFNELSLMEKLISNRHVNCEIYKFKL